MVGVVSSDRPGIARRITIARTVNGIGRMPLCYQRKGRTCYDIIIFSGGPLPILLQGGIIDPMVQFAVFGMEIVTSSRAPDISFSVNGGEL